MNIQKGILNATTWLPCKASQNEKVFIFAHIFARS
jgi:hypothetical protein